MDQNSQRSQRAARGLSLLSAVACLVAAGCSDIHPAPDSEEGGLLESPTHEADAMREEAERQQEQRRATEGNRR